MEYRLGLDVGTHTVTGVLVDAARERPVAIAHRPVGSEAIVEVVQDVCPDPGEVGLVAVTTSYPEHVWEQRDFERVTAVRVARRAETAVPPFHAWPGDLATAVGSPGIVCCADEIVDGAAVIDRLRREGVSRIALTVEDAPAQASLERALGTRLMRLVPGLNVTLSQGLGSVGLLQRENAAIVNATIMEAVANRLDALKAELRSAGVVTSVYLTRYDGLLGDIDYVRRYPVICWGGRLGARARGASIAAEVPDGQLLVPTERGFWLAEVRDGYPAQSDQHRWLGSISTSLPQIRTRHVSTANAWTRIEHDDRLLMREAEAAIGAAQVLAVWSEQPRVLDPLGPRRRRPLEPHDARGLTAWGAASAVVGCECEVITVDDSLAEQTLMDEVRIRAVAAGASPESVRVVMVGKAPVSHTSPSTGGMRLSARAVGAPTGGARCR